jgi:membrane-bound serine protease (ClpP class)
MTGGKPRARNRLPTMLKPMETVAALLVIGTVLVLLETVLPGMIAGVVGFGCLIGGVVMAYANFGPGTGNLVLFGVVAGLTLLGVLWVRFFPTSRVGQMFVTQRTVGNLGVEKPELLEQTGTALTNLRPSGTALIGGKRVDVVTEGPMIERGTALRVVAVEGLRVVVRVI